MNIPAKMGAEYYRDFLTAQAKRIYDLIDAQLAGGDFTGAITFLPSDAKSAAKDAFSAFKALRDDKPEYFFLGVHSEIILKGDGTASFSYSVLYSSDAISKIKRKIDKKVSEITEGAMQLPVTAREKVIYRRIATRIRYKNNDDFRDHSAVGVALMGEGVCEGYTALLLLCLRQVHIPAIKVYGTSESGGSHCWAIVYIYDTPVHCDVTWDSTEGVLVYNYFNLSDEQISADHFNFKGNVPICFSEKYSYYNCHSELTVKSQKELRELLKNRLRVGNPVRFHFGYSPKNFIGEVEKAMESYSGTFRYCFNEKLGNAAVIKVK